MHSNLEAIHQQCQNLQIPTDCEYLSIFLQKLSKKETHGTPKRSLQHTKTEIGC